MEGQRFKRIDHLEPGSRVRVIRAFHDANGNVYREGEEFTFEYVTLNGPKLLPTLHGKGIEIPLNGIEPRQGRLREYFEVKSDTPRAERPSMPARPETMDWALYKVAVKHACALADSGDHAAANACLDQIDKWPFPAECPRDSQIAHDMSECEMTTEAGRAWRNARVESYYGSYVASSTSGGEAAARMYEVRRLLGKR
jgi:hypothetical protein